MSFKRLILLAAALASTPAEAQTCTRLELAVLQGCIRYVGSAVAPTTGAMSSQWENLCARDLQVRYVTDAGEFTAMIPSSGATVPCDNCGPILSWSVDCP